MERELRLAARRSRNQDNYIAAPRAFCLWPPLRFGSVALLIACAHVSSSDLLTRELALPAPGFREPIAAVSANGDAFWPAPSPDGHTIFYASNESGNLDIWAKDLANGDITRLTDHSADDNDPTVSPDGRWVAFVSRRDDAKGDIFIMKPNGDDLQRITGADTGDRAPSFSADGKSIYFTSRDTDTADESIARVDLRTRAVSRIDSGFDPTTDGKVLCYAQKFARASRIICRRLTDDKAVPLTDALRPEAFPRLARDAQGQTWAYYSRYVEDDNHDGRIDSLDRPSLYRAPIDDALFAQPRDRAEPITSGLDNETLCAPAAGRLYFTHQGRQHLEIAALPLTGLLARDTSEAEVLRLASSDIPGKFRRFLWRVLMARNGAEALPARYQLARDFAADAALDEAQNALERLADLTRNDPVLARLGALEQKRNAFFQTLASKHEPDIVALFAAVKAEVDDPPPVQTRAKLVAAECAEAIGDHSDALTLAKQVLHAGFEEDAARAERLIAGAEVIGLAFEDEQRALVALVRAHPRQVREVIAAQKRIAALLPADPIEKLGVVQRLERDADGLPILGATLIEDEAQALIAWHRPEAATERLQKALADTRWSANDRGRLLVALGAAEEAASAYDAAAKTFESLARPTFNSALRAHAQQELNRILLEAAEREEAHGRLAEALAAYEKLVAQDSSRVAAQREVITLAAQLGQAAETYRRYADRAALAPSDKVAQYAAGLAATYAGDNSRAEKYLRHALALDSRQPLAHLALGWLKEQDRSGGGLDEAVDEYSRAKSQFEDSGDAAGAADAALDLGSAFGRLKQYDQAFANDLQRYQAARPFQSMAQQILFLERTGEAAIATEALDVAVMTLREGVSVALSSGDERRLGRLRALLALAYAKLADSSINDDGRAASHARNVLLQARDDYAGKGDTARVIALDRTLGALWLSAGDQENAFEAFERAVAAIKRGEGQSGGFNLLNRAQPVDPLDVSRAPYGFNQSEESEILSTLEARSLRKVGASRAAQALFERRLALISKAADDSATAALVVREWLMAASELALVDLELGEIEKVHALASEALKRFGAADAKRWIWIEPSLSLLRRAPQKWPAKLSADLRAFIDASADADDQDAPRLVARAKTLLALQVAMAKPSFEPFGGVGPEPQPASLSSSLPASLPVDTRAGAADEVAALIDAAEQKFVSGDFVGGEAALRQAIALAESHALFEAKWQSEYLRFRLGDPEQREAALARAGDALRIADVAARLLYPNRPRPALWRACVRALLADAVTKNDPVAALAWQERASETDALVLPTALWLAGNGAAEASRAALAAWAQKPKLAALPALIDKAAEPLHALLTASVDVKALQQALRPSERLVVSLGKRYGYVVVTAQGAELAREAGDATYFSGEAAPKKSIRVGSALGFLLSANADNAGASRLLDLAAPRSEGKEGLLTSPHFSALHLGLMPSAEAPGVVRFALGDDQAPRNVLSSSEIPALIAPAEVAIVDAPKRDSRAFDDLARAFALAGTPSVVFCAGKDPKAHAVWLQSFVTAVASQTAAAALAAYPNGACELWGYSGGDVAKRTALAKAQQAHFEDTAKADEKAHNYRDEVRLYEAALDLAEWLGDSAKSREYRSKLATLYFVLGRFDDAIATQRTVLDEYVHAGDKPAAASAELLLANIAFKAQRLDAAATGFQHAVERFVELKNKTGRADAHMKHAIVLRAAGRYDEAAKAYAAAAAAFAEVKDEPHRAEMTRYLGIIYESNFSDFAGAQKYYRDVLASAVQRKDTAPAQQAHIDIARTSRQLGAYDDALEEIRDVLGAATDIKVRADATLELARIYWYRGDTTRAFAEEEKAAAMARQAKSDSLLVQAVSLEGLILLSDHRLVAATNRLRRALRLARSKGWRDEESTQLNNLGTVLRERGLLAEAEDVFARALAIDGNLKSRDGLAFDWRNLGIAQLRHGRLAEARASLERSLELNKSIGNRYNELQAKVALAEADLVAGQPPSFAEIIDGAHALHFADIEWRARFAAGLSAKTPSDARAAFESALAVALTLPSAGGVASDPRFNPLTVPALGGALAELYAAQNDTAALWQLLERWRLKELRDALPAPLLAERLSVPAEAATWETLAAAARAKNDTALAPVLSLQAAPPPTDGTLVSLRIFQTRAVALVVAHGKASIFVEPMAHADALSDVQTWTHALTDLQPLLQTKLSRWLGTVFGAALGAPEIVIVADETLQALPFAALTVKNAPLMAQAALRFELSGTHALTALAVGAPATAAVVGPSEDDGLPFAGLESDETLALFAENKRSAKRVAIDTVPKANAELLHLALHGRDGSLRGAMLYAQGDGELKPFDVLATRSHARTVVVSACQGGGAAFALAFRLAGAEQVLAPIARVYDEPEARFAKLLVRALARGEGPRALQKLSIAARQNGEPEAVWANLQWWGGK